jgi:hypothetical protein
MLLVQTQAVLKNLISTRGLRNVSNAVQVDVKSNLESPLISALSVLHDDSPAFSDANCSYLIAILKAEAAMRRKQY